MIIRSPPWMIRWNDAGSIVRFEKGHHHRQEQGACHSPCHAGLAARGARSADHRGRYRSHEICHAHVLGRAAEVPAHEGTRDARQDAADNERGDHNAHDVDPANAAEVLFCPTAWRRFPNFVRYMMTPITKAAAAAT